MIKKITRPRRLALVALWLVCGVGAWAATTPPAVLYVADLADGTIVRVGADGVVAPFAGGFSQPAGLVFDPAGNLYVANYGNGVVSRVTPSGLVTT
jgi:sugar lactone lactonase YvrE